MRFFVYICGVIFAVFFAGASLAGCASNMVEMKYSSSIKQNYQLNINSPIIIAYNKGDLLAASYIPYVIELLGRRGFNSLYTQDQLPIQKARNIIYISLVKTIKTTPTSSVQYVPTKMLDKSSCINYDGMYYCREETYPIITGYSTTLNLSSGYHFIMDWYDVHMRKRILYIDGSVDDGPCLGEGVYQDLIYQTISRIDFMRPESYSYSSLITRHSLGCMFQNTKILGVKR